MLAYLNKQTRSSHFDYMCHASLFHVPAQQAHRLTVGMITSKWLIQILSPVYRYNLVSSTKGSLSQELAPWQGTSSTKEQGFTGLHCNFITLSFFVC